MPLSHRLRSSWPAALALAACVTAAVGAAGPSTADIDTQVWQAVGKSVVAHDIVAMGRVYHPAAVLVSKEGTTPIASALDRWGRDMVTAKAKGVRASVEFRFTTRQDDATTAFEAGAFRYATTDQAGVTTPGYVRFEALLVKGPAGWQIVMERQLEAITESAWNALPNAAASAAQAQTPPTCMTLLTADELTKAVGAGFADMGGRDRGEGETECPWMMRGGSSGFKTVSVQFYDLRAVKANPNAATLDAFFEQIVAAGEGAAAGRKREALAGVGQRAAFVPTEPQVLAVVQRADGVARIVGNNLTKAQITAVARAVATP